MPPQDSGRDSPTRSLTTQPSSEGVVKLPKLVSFNELCRCGDEVWIENDGQIYRLRRTKLGKLILTK